MAGWRARYPLSCPWSSTINGSSFGGGSVCTCSSSAVAGNWISISMPAAPKCSNNLNRLAQTQQETRPVHDTLDHFLGHTGAAPYAELRTRMLRRLIRMRCSGRRSLARAIRRGSRCHWSSRISAAALPALFGLSSRHPHLLPASGPGSQIARAGRFDLVHGQRVH